MFHAARSHLDSLNLMQRSFIQELGLTEEAPFLKFSLALLELRRDIAALGLLHKVQLGEAYPDFDALFPKTLHVTPRLDSTHGGTGDNSQKYVGTASTVTPRFSA